MNIKVTKNIIDKYPIEGLIVSVKPFGEGHINETFLVTVKNKNKKTSYILQLINEKIFHPVNKLMENIIKVTTYLKKAIKKRGGNTDRETLTVVLTKTKKSYVKVDNKYYRILTFINNTYSLQVVKEPKDFYQSALAFGDFYKLLSNFDASNIYEIIPNFHNTIKRYNDFLKVLKKDGFKRAKTCQKEIDFINSHKEYYGKLVDALKKKEIPLRVTHNDTKLNNVLFDKKTHKPIAVVDLDTVMPGSICCDFGDAIRFGCNSANEDEKDLKKVYFRLDLYKAFLKGFLSSLGNKITKKEKYLLADASIILTLEQVIRFLTDYLAGDCYYHTKYATHNLVRTRTQIKLVEGMEKNYKAMQKLIK